MALARWYWQPFNSAIGETSERLWVRPAKCDLLTRGAGGGFATRSESDSRSEEHTSELQSPCNLVCRLLLEKQTASEPSEPVRRRLLRAAPGSCHQTAPRPGLRARPTGSRRYDPRRLADRAVGQHPHRPARG